MIGVKKNKNGWESFIIFQYFNAHAQQLRRTKDKHDYTAILMPFCTICNGLLRCLIYLDYFRMLLPCMAFLTMYTLYFAVMQLNISS